MVLREESLLALHSGYTPVGLLETIWDAADQNWVWCKAGAYPQYYCSDQEMAKI